MLTALSVAGVARAAVPQAEVVGLWTSTSLAQHKCGRALVSDVLSAGGASPAASRDALMAFDRYVERLQAKDIVVGDEWSRARAIHQFVHAEILRGKFEASATDVSVTLAGGSYNCATASALFLALACQFDLDARAVSVAGHVWCRVHTHDRHFDVETTCRRWFELPEHRALPADGSASVAWTRHVERAARARELDASAFLAVFHFNRGVTLFRHQQFQACAAANLAAVLLDPDSQEARENLLASLDAWSTAAASGRRGP